MHRQAAALRPNLDFLPSRLRTVLTRESRAGEEALQRMANVFGFQRNATQLGHFTEVLQAMYRHVDSLCEKCHYAAMENVIPLAPYEGELTPGDAFFVIDWHVLADFQVRRQLGVPPEPVDPGRYSLQVRDARRALVAYVFELIIDPRSCPLVEGESAISRLEAENDMLAAASDFMQSLQVMSIEMGRKLNDGAHYNGI